MRATGDETMATGIGLGLGAEAWGATAETTLTRHPCQDSGTSRHAAETSGRAL
ncbi:hypothetical protein ACIQJT_07755 [Streptomyces sp. NPDC091972]|uniref:hypothetical protein n=1 Tax=unclassified Streptomyces TaxID=2593676 RepID=UPI00343AEAC5